MSDSACWCGNTSLAPFNDDYALCEVCQTLVLRHAPAQTDPHVRDDQADFYGRSYWFEHMEQDQGYANIVARSRSDLSDRCVHWLRSVLRYKSPPGKSLELGCGNGSFVAMMRWCGFDATGLELSPWVVEFARSTFQIPMLLGPLEDQKIDSGSLDIVALMDVLEHLPDPLATIRRAAGLLKPDGIIVAQTPAYREGTTFTDLVSRHDPFLVQLKPREHVHLFSRRSVAMLLERAGLGQVWFEPAVFGDYDMFPFASRMARATADVSAAAGDKSGHASPVARSVEALLDLYSRADEAKQLADNRQITIESQARHIAELSADYDRRLAVINEEQARIAELSQTVDQLHVVSATAAARDDELALRRRQLEEKTATIEAMTHHIEQLSADYDRRADVIAELQSRVESSNTRLTILSRVHEQHLAERDEQIGGLVAEAEHHRERLTQVESQVEEKSRVVAEQHEHITRLSADGEQRLAGINARDAKLAEQADIIAAQAGHLNRLSVDYDRRLDAIHARDAQIAEQAGVIAAQAGQLSQVSADYDRRLDAIRARDAQIAEEARTIAAQHEHIRQLSADYDKRLVVINEQAATIARCQAQLDAGAVDAAARKVQVAELSALVDQQTESLAQSASRAESMQSTIDDLRRELAVANDELLALRTRLGVRMLKRLGLA
jgi:2-polyprenyl-3-methyl-5-hydroxy-6-metoxy-1,4-benzoquinol methylase/chromosome segregation ATPase